ncbi:MAG: DUF1330 domain-containing protein [Candidatus Hermodarchaeota archaeon]
MRGYFITQIKIHDFEEYKKYLKGTDAVLKKYKGDVFNFNISGSGLHYSKFCCDLSGTII